MFRMMLLLIAFLSVAGNSTAEPGWTKYLNGEKPGTDIVKTLAIDGNYIWCATSSAYIVRWDRTNGSFTSIPLVSGISAIAIDPNGTKWFGSSGSIYSYDNSIWNSYPVQDSLTIKISSLNERYKALPIVKTKSR